MNGWYHPIRPWARRTWSKMIAIWVDGIGFDAVPNEKSYTHIAMINVKPGKWHVERRARCQLAEDCYTARTVARLDWTGLKVSVSQWNTLLAEKRSFNFNELFSMDENNPKCTRMNTFIFISSRHQRVFIFNIQWWSSRSLIYHTMDYGTSKHSCSDRVEVRNVDLDSSAGMNSRLDRRRWHIDLHCST